MQSLAYSCGFWKCKKVLKTSADEPFEGGGKTAIQFLPEGRSLVRHLIKSRGTICEYNPPGSPGEEWTGESDKVDFKEDFKDF